jgi:hypothetical protein
MSYFKYRIYPEARPGIGPRVHVELIGKTTKMTASDVWDMLNELEQLHKEIMQVITDKLEEEWEIWT